MPGAWADLRLPCDNSLAACRICSWSVPLASGCLPSSDEGRQQERRRAIDAATVGRAPLRARRWLAVIHACPFRRPGSTERRTHTNNTVAHRGPVRDTTPVVVLHTLYNTIYVVHIQTCGKRVETTVDTQIRL